MLYAILNADMTVRELRDYAQLPPHKPGRILPVEEAAKPAFNAATHKLVHGTLVVEAQRVRQDWSIIPLTAEEISANEAIQERQQLKAVVADLRNGTGTTAVRIARCERVLVRLILDLFN